MPLDSRTDMLRKYGSLLVTEGRAQQDLSLSQSPTGSFLPRLPGQQAGKRKERGRRVV